LPTIAETLPGFDLALWAGLVAPAGTPPEIIKRMYGEMQAVLARDDIRKLIVGSGLQMVGGTPRDYAAMLEREHARYGKIIREVGIHPQ
jgi:tripartite-type tricarboxylate transporter receptor subunit TctC